MELDATEVIIDGYNGIHYMFQKIGSRPPTPLGLPQS